MNPMRQLDTLLRSDATTLEVCREWIAQPAWSDWFGFTLDGSDLRDCVVEVGVYTRLFLAFSRRLYEPRDLLVFDVSSSGGGGRRRVAMGCTIRADFLRALELKDAE